VRENEISLCKWSGGTAQFRTLEAGAGPASNVRRDRWDISVVVSFITASHCKKRWSLHSCDQPTDDRIASNSEQ